MCSSSSLARLTSSFHHHTMHALPYPTNSTPGNGPPNRPPSLPPFGDPDPAPPFLFIFFCVVGVFFVIKMLLHWTDSAPSGQSTDGASSRGRSDPTYMAPPTETTPLHSAPEPPPYDGGHHVHHPCPPTHDHPPMHDPAPAPDPGQSHNS